MHLRKKILLRPLNTLNLHINTPLPKRCTKLILHMENTFGTVWIASFMFKMIIFKFLQIKLYYNNKRIGIINMISGVYPTKADRRFQIINDR